MTDTYQPTEAPAPPAPPPPQQDAPAQSSPFDAALTGLERSIANEQRIQQQKESALAPKYAALQSSLSAPIPQPPQPQRMPEAPKPPGPEQALFGFATAMLLLGALSSKYTRMSSGAALSSFNGALQGWQAGNLQAYEEKSKEWEANTKATIQNNKQETEQYKEIMENRKLNIDQQMDQIKVTAAQYQDKMMFEAANAKNYTLVAQIWEKKNEAGAKLQLQSQKLLDDREKQKQKNEQTAQYWLSPEGQQRLALPEGQPGALTEQQKAGVGQLIQVYGSKGQGTQTPEKIALQRFLEEHPNATAEEIQKFRNQGKQPRSAQGMSLARYLEENPNATSEDIQKFTARQAGLSAEERTGAVKAANLDIIMRNAHAAIPMAVEASKRVPRTSWVPVNELVQRAETAVSNPELKEFRLANLQLAELWARAMNPSGVMRESDRQLALDMLSTADSPQTYERVAKQLENFLQRERKSVQEFRQHIEPEKPFNPSAGSPTAGGVPTKVQTPADAESLAPGTHYVTPDGREMIR